MKAQHWSEDSLTPSFLLARAAESRIPRVRAALCGSLASGGRKLKFKCGRDVQSAERRESGD